MGQRYRRIDDQKPGPGLACNLILQKGKDLKQKSRRFPKFSKLGELESKLV